MRSHTMVEPVPAEPTKILIVDDDGSVRDVITVLLSEEGYACTAVSSAEAALDAARHAEYPLVISDVRMPGRDGLWLLERLRDGHPDTAVVMLTAYGDTEAAVECLRNGAADYLLKPPKVTELIRAIERALGRRRLELARQKYRRSLENRVREKTAELSSALRELESTYSQTLWSLVAGARRPRARDGRPLPARRALLARDRAPAGAAGARPPGARPRRPPPRHREDRRARTRSS